MKYAFMTFSTPDLTLEETLKTARRYGYSGIEPRLVSKHRHGIETTTSPAERKAIRDKVCKSGIELACLATSIKYADPAQADEMIETTHDSIDLAGDIGAPALRIFGGPIPEGVTREQAADSVTRSLRRVADHAAERNVIVCFETHDHWCDPADVAGVLKRVNHPAIAVNWDVMHPVRQAGKTMDEAFETLRPWIRHLHVHDGTKGELKMLPIGTGDFDHRRVIELMNSINYTGFISGEWINWEPWETHLPREIATLKRYEEEIS
ncbi:sugar phosphate isomerase/epimerase [bacterium]|nr:sugar phosphate isomerase/epimerase [bacterium]